MSGRRSPEVRKTESPEESKKPEATSPKSEVKPIAERRKQKAYPKSDPDSYRDESLKSEEESTSAPDSYRDDVPNSEINKSDPDSYRDKHSNSEIENKSEIENPKSKITMEVHHHPDVEKKGLKEYILEGLMIFLAVFMGFMAESLREHIGDRDPKNHIWNHL